MKRLIMITVVLSLLYGCDSKHEEVKDEGISLSKAMGETSDSTFSKAFEKKKFVFPDDHGPHPDFRTEWWYFTGNLTSDDGKIFGYQFTVFRTALTGIPKERTSAWSSDQIYMSHFTVTDISGDEFYFEERFSRNGNGLAGAKISPFKVWLEDWQIVQSGDVVKYDLPVIEIKAKTENVEIDFILESVKPIVLQGDSGLSRKGSQPGNASYYYSYTKLKTDGKIRINGKEFKVNGYSWMDREWSTSALSEDQKGWDWFALQLDDSTEIMYYQLRKQDGSADKFSKGILVMSNGGTRLLSNEEVVMTVTDFWESSGGVKYPSGWKLKIPSENIDLVVKPVVRNQLLDVSIKYWEGSVEIAGTSGSKQVSGRGYVELTGY
jgi:predicted secreted hydrolase